MNKLKLKTSKFHLSMSIRNQFREVALMEDRRVVAGECKSLTMQMTRMYHCVMLVVGACMLWNVLGVCIWCVYV